MTERSCAHCHHRFEESDLLELINGEMVCGPCGDANLEALNAARGV